MFTFMALLILASGKGEVAELKINYLRPTGKGFESEASFNWRRGAGGWEIDSQTGRGATRMSVSAAYDAKDRLFTARAVLTQKDMKSTAMVVVKDGKVQVTRQGDIVQEFDIPPGVIVTSAPDWADIFLLCAGYDQKRGGKQEKAGLWIHPTQPAQRLTFRIEREAVVKVSHADKTIALTRFRIHIRGPNPYLAWADAEGVLVKLVPLPAKDGVASGLIREGYEKLWSELRVDGEK